MTSRLRGPSAAVKEGAKISGGLAKHCREEHPEDLKPYRNGAKESRYHFGMTKHDVIRKNGREPKDASPPPGEDPDFLYRRSKQHFGAWDIKGVAHEENSRAKRAEDRNEDNHVSNGKHKNEPRDEGYAGSLPREHRARTESADRDRSKRPADSESPTDSRNSTRTSRPARNNGSKEEPEDDLAAEIDHLHVDSRSPDRRIRAMIERFKSREEGKLKSRREPSSLSPEKDEHSARSKSGTRNDSRTDHSPDNWANNRSDRNRAEEEDREEPRRSSRHKYRELDKSERDASKEAKNHRSRSKEKHRESSRSESRREDSKRVDSFREKSEHSADRSHRRRSKEGDDDQSRSKDTQKRRSYTYDGNPGDFDIKIQRYERALLEPRKDPEFSRRGSSMDREQDLGRKDSFKEHDKQPRKNSFKSSDLHKKRDSSLNRKTSFKDQDGDVYRKNSFKNHQDPGGRYFAKDQDNDLSRKSSFKEHAADVARKSSFKEQSSGEYGRIQKNRGDEADRKHSFKEHQSGVSRITFKDCDAEPARNNTGKDDLEAGRVSFKDRGGEIARRNSFKEKTVEFAGISYKEDDDIEERHARRDHNDTKSFKDYQETVDSPNGRYEFGKVSFREQEDELRASPPREELENEVRRKSSSKDRDGSAKRRISLRSKVRDAAETKSERHARPLSPPRIGEPDRKDEPTDRDAFASRAWLDSNKLFSAKYLREHSRFRSTPEGHADADREYLEVNCQDRRSPRRATPERARHVCEAESIESFALKDTPDSPEAAERFPRSREDTRVTSTTQNGATIIRIRGPQDAEPLERRRRRRQEPHGERRRRQLTEEEDESEEEEPEEEQRVRSRRETFMPGRAGPAAAAAPTPSRRLWNYREGGVLITDVEDGQPCLECGGTCPGFSPHSWRKNCTSCKCPREAHDVCHEEWVSVRSRLGLKGEESTSPVGFDPRARGLAWAPPGLPAHKVEEYFSMVPEISVPRLGTPGERQRDRQLAFQLPKQDLARAYCRHLNPKHASSADDFMAARNEIALDIGSVQEVLERDLDCGACNAPLKYGTLAVSASKLGLLYHPACFRCNECKELLVDLAYCVHDDILYCERHYAEQLKPRCAACDELIFSGEYTKAMNKDWHSGHFCCWQCDESLTGQRYVLRDEHPYCIKCYESVFANGCEECNKIIGIDSKDLSYKDKHWHEACFLCNRCRVSLVDKQFGSKVDKIYCGNCYDAQFASRCDGCGEIFRAGTKKMEYKTRQWHEKCFCCVVCKNPIGTKSFIPREQEIYCAGCYEDKFATRCVKCNKIITSGGVTYKNEPWHRDCFTCSNCNNSLAGQRFTSRDDKPYCADCFGELFAKRCTACTKPITGIGGTRFISFEDRHWHNDCFICAGCKTSLVGRGFITDGEDIICPECAKMKLM